MLTREPHPGDRLQLPSGRTVEVIGAIRGRGDTRIDCAFVRDGEIVPIGLGQSGRVALTVGWLMRYAEGL